MNFHKNRDLYDALFVSRYTKISLDSLTKIWLKSKYMCCLLIVEYLGYFNLFDGSKINQQRIYLDFNHILVWLYDEILVSRGTDNMSYKSRFLWRFIVLLWIYGIIFIWCSESRFSDKNFERAVFIQQILSIYVHKYMVFIGTFQNGYFWVKTIDLYNFKFILYA